MTLVEGAVMRKRLHLRVALALLLVASALLAWTQLLPEENDSRARGMNGWQLLQLGGRGSRLPLFSSLHQVSPAGEGYVTNAGVRVPPASVVVRGAVVDVVKGRAFAGSPDPNARSSPVVPFDAAPPGSALFADLVVQVDEVVAGALPSGVSGTVQVEVGLPAGTTIADLRAAFNGSGSAVWFLKAKREADALLGLPLTAPENLFRIMADLVFVEDGGRLQAPLLAEDEVETIVAGIDTLSELRAAIT